MFRTLHATRISTRNLFAVRRRHRRRRRRTASHGRLRPASTARPPAHPAVICNTIRFAAAVDSPGMLLGGVVESLGMGRFVPAQGERTGLALACCVASLGI